MPDSTAHALSLPGLEPAPSLRVAFLGSGSSGNATAIAFDSTLLLLDAGFSARETHRRLAEAGLGELPIAALLLTHEHADHVAGVRVLAKRGKMPVYATAGTWRGVRDTERPETMSTLSAEDSLRIGAIDVSVFRSSHDSAEPVGYVFAAGRRRVGICTDSGELTPEAAELLAGCDLLGIESNHDVEMLERGPYPYFLKRRILSARGHLSNRQAGDALERLACDRLKTIVGLHLSRTNNTPRHAKAVLQARANVLGLRANVHVANQFEPLVCDIGCE